MKRRNRANHTPHARLFVDAQPPGHVRFTYKELTESLRRKSRQLCATYCREQVQQLIGPDARKQTKLGRGCCVALTPWFASRTAIRSSLPLAL